MLKIAESCSVPVYPPLALALAVTLKPAFSSEAPKDSVVNDTFCGMFQFYGVKYNSSRDRTPWNSFGVLNVTLTSLVGALVSTTKKALLIAFSCGLTFSLQSKK